MVKDLDDDVVKDLDDDMVKDESELFAVVVVSILYTRVCMMRRSARFSAAQRGSHSFVMRYAVGWEPSVHRCHCRCTGVTG